MGEIEIYEEDPHDRVILRTADVTCKRCGLKATVGFRSDGLTQVELSWPEFEELCEMEPEVSPLQQCEALEESIRDAGTIH